MKVEGQDGRHYGVRLLHGGQNWDLLRGRVT
jgi:hypothetical protein